MTTEETQPIPADSLQPHITFVQASLWKLYQQHHNLGQTLEALQAMSDAADDHWHTDTVEIGAAITEVLERVTCAMFGITNGEFDD